MEYDIRKIHLIAIGGSVMHALGIALHKLGIEVTGSDNQFFDPSREKLQKHGLLPKKEGYFEENITKDLDMVILGMHANEDNPELKAAKAAGLSICSFPEFIYEHTKHKQRIVIGGSHGKTTITSMIMHVLKVMNHEFDYVVGADLTGFDNRVKLSEAPLIIIEGDEYLSSNIDPTPKFLNYHHHIGLISGISWDHVNVFPSEDEYVSQFDKFADATPKAGTLVYNDEDSMACVIGAKERTDVRPLPYETHPSVIENGITYLLHGEEKVKLKIFGKHNMLNLNGAKQVLSRLSITDEDFYQAIRTFESPSLRMELLMKNDHDSAVFRDYAHSPSKVNATTLALKEQYPNRELTACLELNTYSSLNKQFLKQYKDSLSFCNKAIVFYNPEAIKQKQLMPIDENDIKVAFDFPDLLVINDSSALEDQLRSIKLARNNVLLMSSSNFGGIDFSKIF